MAKTVEMLHAVIDGAILSGPPVEQPPHTVQGNNKSSPDIFGNIPIESDPDSVDPTQYENIPDVNFVQEVKNEIENKASQINITDNGDGTATFVKYGGEDLVKYGGEGEVTVYKTEIRKADIGGKNKYQIEAEKANREGGTGFDGYTLSIEKDIDAARGISLEKSSVPGNVVFTDYDGARHEVQSGFDMVSSDETVVVKHPGEDGYPINPGSNDYGKVDFSIQPEITRAKTVEQGLENSKAPANQSLAATANTDTATATDAVASTTTASILQTIWNKIRSVVNAMALKVGTTQTINGTAYGTGNITITAAPSGTAGGDLAGTYPNPTLAAKTRTNTTSTASPGSAGTFTAIDSVTTNAAGQVTGANTKEVTMPTVPSVPSAGNLTGQSAVAGQSASNGSAGTWARSDHYHALPAAPTIPTSLPPNGNAGGDLAGTYPNPTLAAKTRTNTTSTASPGSAGTFTAIDSVTTNAAGQVTGANTKEVTIPTIPTVNMPWQQAYGGPGNGDGANKWQRVWRVPYNNGVIDDLNYFFVLRGNFSIQASFLMSMRKDFRSANNFGALFFDIMASNARDLVSKVRFTGDSTYIYLELAQNYGGTTCWASDGELINQTTTAAPAHCWTVPGLSGNGTSGNWATGTVLLKHPSGSTTQYIRGDGSLAEFPSIPSVPSFPLSIANGGTAANNGYDALQNLIYNSLLNTALGSYALYSNTTGNRNIAIGSYALYNNTTGGNTAIGYCALYNNTTAGGNAALGYYALYSNTTGNYNTALGYQALYNNTTGAYNTAIGASALYNNTTGGNTAIGYSALYNNTTGAYNTAIGYQALCANTTGNYNTALGYYALHNNTDASGNTAIGHRALYANTTATTGTNPASGYNNTALGYCALSSNTYGDYNTAIGYNTLYANTTGIKVTAVGCDALQCNTTGICNTAVGWNSLGSNTTGINNTAVGNYVLRSNTTASNNTAMGYNALRFTTGGGNTAIGVNSGHATNGTATAYANTTNSVFIGCDSRPGGDNQTNQIVIGNGAQGNGSNTIQLGNNQINAIYCQQTSITYGSDIRLKEDVQPANLDMCVEAVKNLPVNRYKYKDFTGAHNDKHVTGFLADDVEKVFPKAVSKLDRYFPVLDENGKVEKEIFLEDVKHITMTEATPTLWGAMQKLIERVEILEAKRQESM